jgi:glycosyltransferase involved in cell wall biosynthesis
LDIPELEPLFKEFKDVPVVSISEAQRSPLPWANWQGTVYHGLPLDLFTFRQKAGSYLGFLGRICPEKGVDHAIQIAKQVGIPLKIAAKVDKVDQIYFEDAIRPLLDDSLIQYVGEISHSERDGFFGNALAILFPIEWPEPFGLVMIEAMACGTPVIAYRRGSVPEVLEDGMTGFIVDGIDEAVKAVSRVGTMNRLRIHEVFETRYSVARMTADYLFLYRQLVRLKPEFVAVLS